MVGIVFYWFEIGFFVFGEMGVFFGGLVWVMIFVVFLFNVAVLFFGVWFFDVYFEVTVIGAVFMIVFIMKFVVYVLI